MEVWRLEKDLPAPYNEVLHIGMVFMDDKIPVVKQFKDTHFFPVSKVDYLMELLLVIYGLSPGGIRKYYLHSLINTVKRL